MSGFDIDPEEYKAFLQFRKLKSPATETTPLVWSQETNAGEGPSKPKGILKNVEGRGRDHVVTIETGQDLDLKLAEANRKILELQSSRELSRLFKERSANTAKMLVVVAVLGCILGGACLIVIHETWWRLMLFCQLACLVVYLLLEFHNQWSW
jgi:hypothetical protein